MPRCGLTSAPKLPEPDEGARDAATPVRPSNVRGGMMKANMWNRLANVVSMSLLTMALAGCSNGPTKIAAAKQETGAAAFIAKWNLKLVRRPGPTPEDGKVYLIRDGQKYWVISREWIKKNGYKWPDDVYQVSAEELERVPLGGVIE